MLVFSSGTTGLPKAVRHTHGSFRDAPLDIDIRFPFPIERMAEMTPGYTANRAVNAVPFVVAAARGIRTTADLPQIIAALG